MKSHDNVGCWSPGAAESRSCEITSDKIYSVKFLTGKDLRQTGTVRLLTRKVVGGGRDPLSPPTGKEPFFVHAFPSGSTMIGRQSGQ